MRQSTEEYLVRIMKEKGITGAATLPCGKIKNLLLAISDYLIEIPLTREEEGIGICSGAYLAGAKVAMVIQSSGIGNSVNALMSLAKLFEIPIPIFISWRGIWQEKIFAQTIMGKHLTVLLESLEIPYLEIRDERALSIIEKGIDECYAQSTPYLFLLSPKVWQDSSYSKEIQNLSERRKVVPSLPKSETKEPEMTRFELLNSLVPFLKNKVVACNMGFPSRELYAILDQPSNFYMVGSLGMVSSIGLGIALYAEKEVTVIDGDGSLLMNPNALFTIAAQNPRNLTIIAIDNGVYASTGNQTTAARRHIDLEQLALCSGIENTAKAYTGSDIEEAYTEMPSGPRFIHALAKPGNANVGVIPLGPQEIKERFIAFLST